MLLISINNILIRTLPLLICIIYSHVTFAQVFEFEQSPPSVKWRQINTPTYHLIYPQEVEKEAQFTANLLDKYAKAIGAGIRTKPRKIPIILRNQSVESNGFVQLSPRRSEFFLTPPQNSDPYNWLASLSIHEYRHVVQIDKLTPKPPFELVGLAYFGISLPPWLYEGDAVLMETLLTTAGRGRLPSWEMPFRTNVLAGKKYSYQKNYLGSMKDITSGYYELGYFITTKIRREYSASLIDSVLDRMSSVPIKPYNFSNSLKKITGRKTKQWYTETRLDLIDKWEKQLQKNDPIDYPLLNVDSTKTNHLYLPQFMEENGLIALAVNPENVATIVHIDSLGNQHKIFKTGKQIQPSFSYANGKIVWDEIRSDKRYLKQNYSLINRYDLATKSYKQLSHKSRLFSPTLNHQGTEIAAIEITKNYQEFLVLMDAETGKEHDRIPVPKDLHIQNPSFHTSGEKVIAIALSTKGSNLIEFNIPERSCRILLTHLTQEFERPIYAEDQIIFKASYNGIDNIYQLNPINNSVAQLTNARYGAFNPAYDASTKSIVFNNYQAFGYQISKLNLNEIEPKPIEAIENTFINYFEPLLTQEEAPVSLDSVITTKYASTPYKEINHLFNFHSLSVGSDTFESIGDLKLGLLLLSDNLLNTLSVRVGAAYNQEIHRPEFGVTLRYQRFFPKFNFKYSNAGKLSGIKLDADSDQVTSIRWRENEIKLNMEIPLSFNRLNHFYQSGFRIGSSFTHRYRLSRPEINDQFIRKLILPLDVEFYFNRNAQRSQYDIAPQWGQNINLFFRSSPFEKQLTGKAFSLQSTFYFPGILPNHSFRTRFNYQYHSGNFQYSNYIPMINGYDQLKASLPENTLLLDYRFPIAYPDWELGPLAYIRRLKGGFFSHFENFGQYQNFQPRTLGAELRADMNLLRFFLPIVDVGVTAIYVNEPNEKDWLFQVGFSYAY